MSSLSGIDCSNNNGMPTVSGALAAATAAFVIVKASEGEHTADADHDAFVAIARKLGKKVGHYHFGHPTQDPVKEADFFLSQAAAKPGDVLALDLEASEGTRTQQLSYALAWLSRVKRVTAVKPLVYSYTSYLRAVLAVATAAQKAELLSYPLWIADPNHAVGHPDTAGWGSWAIHQYAISGGLDRNLLNGDAAFWAKLAIPVATPAPAPAPKPAPAPAPKPSGTSQWRKLVDHVMAVPEKIYETRSANTGWNNITQYGQEFGENGVAWCVIFDWCMYAETGLTGIVPKTDNVNAFTSWAKAHGQWSEYPSIGAWVNFGNGAHTEIVVGFDANNVYTKGGNSVKAGATDNGQGNGVFSHSRARRDPYVVGYFAPKFADGVCPPTADPHDYRGGKAVTAWRYSPAAPVPAPKPSVSLAHILAARSKDIPAPDGHKTYPADVVLMERALAAEGLLAGRYVDGSFGTKTQDAYDAFRRRVMHLSGSAATGAPGMQSLSELGKRHGFQVKA